MQSKIKVRKAKLEGSSGVKHEVELAEYNGKEYILIKASDNPGTPSLELLVRMIVCYDLNKPPMLLVKPNYNIPSEIKKLIDERGGIVVKE